MGRGQSSRCSHSPPVLLLQLWATPQCRQGPEAGGGGGEGPWEQPNRLLTRCRLASDCSLVNGTTSIFPHTPSSQSPWLAWGLAWGLPGEERTLTAAVSRSAPDTVAASVSRGTDMVLPHIHCRLHGWGLCKFRGVVKSKSSQEEPQSQGPLRLSAPPCSLDSVLGTKERQAGSLRPEQVGSLPPFLG